MGKAIHKKLNKDGFTLVELIVVLVILAILAALLVPALTGYIDKANETKATTEARMAVMATKAEVAALYGELTSGQNLTAATVEQLNTSAKNAFTLTEFSTASNLSIAAKVDEYGNMLELIYTTTTYQVIYDGNTFTGKSQTEVAPNKTLTITVEKGKTGSYTYP